MPGGGKRGLVAPQNTFLENIVRRFNSMPDTSFILANAQIIDFPIVHCSESFCKMVGLSKTEVMQRSSKCQWMVGDKTDKATVEKLVSALDNHLIDQFEILLYKDKEKNKCMLFLNLKFNLA